MSLLDDLTDATRKPECPLCAYIAALPENATKAALTEAAGGTIGINRLAAILQKHKTGVGRRTIARHRNEGHMKQ